MRFKYMMMLTIILTSLLAVSAVSATDIDTNDTQIVSVSDNDEIVSMESDLNVLTDNEEDSSYSDLRIEIGTGGDKILTKKNYRYVDGDGEGTFTELQDLINAHYDRDLTLNKSYTYNNDTEITITGPITIYGNGNTLNANNGCFIFKVTGSNVVIQDLVFTNGNATDGGAINWEGENGTLTNCSFTNNHADGGGAVYWWGESGTLTNCSFTNNHATSGSGGAVYFNSSGNVTKCNFTHNNASQFGGALYFYNYGNFTNNNVNGPVYNWDGNVTNCNFIDNTATSGGAVGFDSSDNGYVTVYYFVKVENCNFTNNTATQTGGAVYFSWDCSEGSVKNCNFINNKATSGSGGAVLFGSDGRCNVANCNFTDNKAFSDGGAIVFGWSGNVINCYFTNNTETSGDGGAICGYSGSVENCTFINNSALGTFNKPGYYTGLGGAIYFVFDGSVKNCNFTNNTATQNGGGVYFGEGGSVENCNFTNNKATSGSGGAIFLFNEGSSSAVKNCNFTNNTATYGDGGAICFFIYETTGTVKNCNFIDNDAASGGAVCFNSLGNDYGKVENCNFTNNIATRNGGAVCLSEGSVENCNFINNSALGTFKISGYYSGGSGGAIFFSDEGYSSAVKNCNFTNNTATQNGGAISMNWLERGSVENCNFINNSALGTFGYYGGSGGAVYIWNVGTCNVANCNFTDNHAERHGGAIYFSAAGTVHEVKNCNFANNSARYGGAVNFNGTDNPVREYDGGPIILTSSSVTNSNFTGNNAATGSAIYFERTHATVSNSIFLNNRANAEALGITKNDNNIKITLRGNDNLLNAIYSNVIVRFTNVTYWGANGIANTGSSPATPSGSKYEAGQNITLEIYDFGGTLVENVTLVTDNYGQAVYDFIKLVDREKYKYNAYHLEDSYYTYAEKNDTFSVGVGDFTLLQRYINEADADSVLILYCNYTFTIGWDEKLTDGIVIDKPITINGNGHTINALQKARIFKVTAGNVVLNNITFANATTSGDGGAVYVSSYGSVINCNFTDNHAEGNGGAIYFNYLGTTHEVKNCNFIDNKATRVGGAIYFTSEGSVVNCNFTNNTATREGGAVRLGKGSVENCNFTNNVANSTTYGGGAIFFSNAGNVTNCNFANNSARYGGAVYFWNNGKVTNSNFTNNTATQFGGAVYFGQFSEGSVVNCNFTNNTADKGGAVHFSSSGSVINCNFTDNHAEGNGGAVYFNKNVEGNVTDCSFNNNSASSGGAVYFDEGSYGREINCNFTNNIAASWGGAINFDTNGTVTNCNFANNSARDGGAIMASGSVEHCNFTNNSATKNGGAVYFFSNYGGTVTNCNFTDNNATTGSAIYFDITSATKTVSNSIFLNNRANAEALEITKNDNNITITFKGNDNLLNAIYSKDDAEVRFTNVTYWSASGINKTGSFSIPSRSKNEAGQNITVGVVVNGELVLDDVKVTDENGMIVLDISAGENYFIGVRHDTDSYYTEAEKIISKNTKFNVNVTSQSATNRTVNITAKSNIPNEIIKGKLLFILPNGTEISANYNADGTWWAVHAFEDIGDYEINASYNYGLEDVTVNIATVSIKVNVPISVDNINIFLDDVANVVVSVPEALNGQNITITVNGTSKNSTVKNGNATASFADLPAGEYIINVDYSGDGINSANSTTAKLTVNKVDSSLSVDDLIFDYNTVGNTTMSFTGAIGVSAEVIGQSKANVNVKDNVISVSGLDAGNYTLEVTTVPDAKHNAVTATANVIVSKVDTVIVVNTAFSRYATDYYSDGTKDGVNGERGGFFYATLYDVNGNPLANKTVQIAINGPIYNVTTDENGQAGLQVNLAKANTYTYALYFPGDEGYSASLIASSKLTVVKKPTSIIANSKYSFKSSAKTKTVAVALNTIKNPFNNELYLKAGKKVTLTVNGKTYSAKTDSKGVAKFNIKLTKKGTYTATVKFAGDSTYESVSKSVKISISKSAGSNAALKGVGIGTAPKELDDPGALNVEGNYADYVVNSNISTGYACPAKKATIIVVDKNFTRNATDYYSDGTKDGVNGERGGFFYATLTDSDGNPLVNKTVQIAVNGPIYNVTTDKDGQAGLQVNLAKANTYTYALSFSGDDEYCPAMLASSKLTVIKKPITIDVKGLSFKANAKTKTVTVTLKTIKNAFDGKIYLKDGKKVTLKVNGVTYIGFIKNGVVKFNVKLAKKGTYRAVVSFAGDSTYGSTSKTVNIKVK